MTQPPSAIRDLFRGEKLLLARGASQASSGPQLETLVLLADDADEEVRRIAGETLERLSDEYCAQQLAAGPLPEVVARYFLDPERLRSALLPALLGNPECPQSAIVEFIGKAGPEVLPLLLEHLDLLETPALLALRENPSYPALQTRQAAESRPLTEADKLAFARGAKSITEVGQLNTLVALASDPGEDVRQAALQALSRLSEEDCVLSLADPALEAPTARYFLSPSRARPALLPILLASPACPPDAVAELAAQAGPEIIPVLLDNLDLLQTSALIALKDNPAYLTWQKEPRSEGVVLEVDLLEMLIAESEAEALRPVSAEAAEVAAGEQKEGLTGKIAKMTVAQKVKLALLGNREDRSLLIRDGSRVVSRAVLGSPKLNESEVEGFASMKNVDQEVLRSISMNRKFMKNYSVMKNLVSNPRLPLDIGLTLLSRLLATDMQLLSKNRDVPDTLRKMADKFVKSRRPGAS